MIPKRQHIEQTTEGTISYLRSISWSHLRPTSDKPNSRLVDVMMADVEGERRRTGEQKSARARDERDVAGCLGQRASPVRKCPPVNGGRREKVEERG